MGRRPHRHGTPVDALRNFTGSQIPLPRRIAVTARNAWLRIALRQGCCGHDGEPGC